MGEGGDAPLVLIHGFCDDLDNWLYRLTELRAPCRVAWGAADRIVPPSQSVGLSGAIDIHLHDGVGPMPHMEAVGAVNRLIAG